MLHVLALIGLTALSAPQSPSVCSIMPGPLLWDVLTTVPALPPTATPAPHGPGAWKGNPEGVTFTWPTSCNVQFELGREYVVYANGPYRSRRSGDATWEYSASQFSMTRGIWPARTPEDRVLALQAWTRKVNHTARALVDRGFGVSPWEAPRSPPLP